MMTAAMGSGLRAGGQGTDQQDDCREMTVHCGFLTEQPQGLPLYKTAGTVGCTVRLSKGFVSADQR
jgi:hypothetical protein